MDGSSTSYYGLATASDFGCLSWLLRYSCMETEQMMNDGWYWVKSSVDEDYHFIVRVDGGWVFRYGDATWYKQEDFMFVNEIRGHTEIQATLAKVRGEK
jgi:hypothetical protein